MARVIAESDRSGLVRLSALAAIAGVAIGFVGGAFRWVLERAERVRIGVVDWANAAGGPSWLVPILIVAAGAGIARALVTLVPLAGGSGIQHVEAVWRKEADPPPLRVLPARFFGGLIAIGSGLVLGREGPTVHMGAALGAAAGVRARVPDDDVRVLQAALAGAGLAVAFNAPVGGALFVLEEVARTARLRLVLTTAIACAVAVSCSRLLVGDHPDFLVAPQEPAGLPMIVLFAVFGLLTGAVGVVYNKLVTGALAAADRLHRVPPTARAAVLGALVGLALYVSPFAVGGGDVLTQQLLTDGSVVLLPAVLGYFLVRFVTGPLSYAAGTPGGLFAPLLALGALWGVLFHAGAALLPGVGPSPIPFALVGMAAFFAATVRAPFTGIVLIVEMTTIATVTVPMLAACFAATLTATLLRNPPVYDSLRRRMLGHRD
ncbi:ClC family H(+)/Cl(-) exchange transporter [Nakamurella sp.]|uniref:ClC family H(+)/Cl(-) exchange transporter n=1 Tax=Nakamurella sp. TaxID=1869182 RepID=UPI00378320B0